MPSSISSCYTGKSHALHFSGLETFCLAMVSFLPIALKTDPNTTLLGIRAPTPADLELTPSSCEPENGLGAVVKFSESHQPHACGTGVESTQAGEENISQIDHESQLDKKPSSIHMMLRNYGSLIAVLAILILHIILALNGGPNAGHSLTLSLGACNDGVAVNASRVGEGSSCFRMNQTFGS
jgi:hypothetical protein